MQIGIAEARKQLSQLIQAVEQGEPVLITRNGNRSLNSRRRSTISPCGSAECATVSAYSLDGTSHKSQLT